jgi:flagellar export protein FliJ
MEAIHHKLNAERLSLESCRQELKYWMQSLLESESGQTLDLTEITLIYKYIEALEQRAAQHERTIQCLNHELDEKRKEYLAASQAEKIMDKLKEKEWTAFLVAANRQECAFLDEVAGRSHGHGNWE